ncbi:hypothetical protein ACI2L1_36805 [Streptomyces sp. NPDC019531]|uniref:hypothetical protein n=1 Tax=Streptomyces sp. NPDC019531 TaxID=3365062 RepID=UPI00384B08B7
MADFEGDLRVPEAPGVVRPRPWALPVVVNLVMGVVVVIPVWSLVLFAVSYRFAALGVTSGSPTENDGMLPWAIVLVLLWTAFLAMWIPANLLSRRRVGASRARYWACATLLVLVPTTVLTCGIAVR